MIETAEIGSKRYQPKLSLLYLMTFVVGFGICLGLRENLPAQFASGAANEPSWKLSFQAVLTFAGGICISGMAIVLFEAFNSDRRVRHPGYLLLLVCGFLTLFTLTTTIWMGIASAGSLEQEIMIPKILSLASYIAAGVMLYAGVFKYCWWWRIAFACLGLAMFSRAAMAFWQLRMEGSEIDQGNIVGFLWLANLGAMLLVIAASWQIICVIVDLVSKTHRDWVHWLGVLGFVFSGVVPPILFWFASRYLGPESFGTRL